MKKTKWIILKIISFILVIVICFSGYKIIMWFLDNKHNAELANELVNTAQVAELTDEELNIVEESVETAEEKPAQSSDYWNYMKMNMLDVDLSELKTKNPDTVAWIKVNGTNINYPVVQSQDNDYYLTHSYDRSANDAGWVFMDYRNSSDGNFDRNTILYAHARLDKTMFGSLRDIMDSGWYNNSNNYVVKMVVGNKTTLWQVFSIYVVPSTSDYLRTKFSSDEDYTSFLSMLKNRSEKDFHCDVDSKSKILTLSTCKSGDRRVVLHAKLIKSGTK